MTPEERITEQEARISALEARLARAMQTIHAYGLSANVVLAAVDVRLKLLEAESKRLALHHPKPENDR